MLSIRSLNAILPFNASFICSESKPYPTPLTAHQEKLLTAAWQSPSSPLIPRPGATCVCSHLPRVVPSLAALQLPISRPGCSLPSHAHPCWERPALGPSGSSPDAGKVTPLPHACQRTAGLLWLHVCNHLKKTSRPAYSADYKE